MLRNSGNSSTHYEDVVEDLSTHYEDVVEATPTIIMSEDQSQGETESEKSHYDNVEEIEAAIASKGQFQDETESEKSHYDNIEEIEVAIASKGQFQDETESEKSHYDNVEEIEAAIASKGQFQDETESEKSHYDNVEEIEAKAKEKTQVVPPIIATPEKQPETQPPVLPKVGVTATASGNQMLAMEKTSQRLFKKNPKVLKKEVLGQGAFGKVKVILVDIEGMEEKEGIFKKAAVKIIKNSDPSILKITKLFDYVMDKNKEEINLPGLLVPYAIFQEVGSDKTFQIMPIADSGNGDEIIERIANSHLSQEEKTLLKRHIFFSLARSFLAMDKYGIKHLDVKPANILFDKQGNCYVCDFDFSIILNEDGSFYHKPDVMKADVQFTPYNHIKKVNISNRSFITGRLDAYRLGVTLLLLCGEMTKETYKKLKFNHLSAEQIENWLAETDTPQDMKDIVKGLLDYDINNRTTFSALWDKVKDWEIEPKQIQEIFSRLNGKEKANESIAEPQSFIPTENMRELKTLAKSADVLQCSMEELIDALADKDSLSSSRKLRSLTISRKSEASGEKEEKVEEKNETLSPSERLAKVRSLMAEREAKLSGEEESVNRSSSQPKREPVKLRLSNLSVAFHKPPQPEKAKENPLVRTQTFTPRKRTQNN